MKSFIKNLYATAIIFPAIAVAGDAQVKILDASHDPAGTFLAYTEFELSGEPLAEALGLDLDVLDPNAVNKPTAFDYTAGIESYEYSEEAMYALNYQSQMGPHLVNGPQHGSGDGIEALNKRISELAVAVGFPANEIPKNLYPISLPYQSGLPKLSELDSGSARGEEIEVINARGRSLTQKTRVNHYFGDYKNMVWDRASFSRKINPAVVGGILLKEVMWSQDFLGGMHEAATDEELEADSSIMDRSGKYRLGVSAADGFQGMLLTEISLDKMLILQDRLGYDGRQLGAKFTPDYNAKKNPVWFAHQVAVNEEKSNGVNALGELKVIDGRSTLRDTWMLLWPTSEFFAFTDQREKNSAQNPAFMAVFDGEPFASAPEVNRDANSQNDKSGRDAFSLSSNLSNLLFQNIDALHFNGKAGTFVDHYDGGKQGSQVTSFDAAYAIVALSIFQRARDALPVGYSAGEGGDINLKTADGKRALSLIKAQADFLLKQAVGPEGLVYDSIRIGHKASGDQSLATQFAVIRGLIAAGLATESKAYLDAAKKIYLAVEKHRYDADLGTWSDQPGQPAEYTPWTAAATSGALRKVMLHLANQEGQHEPALELRHLAKRYVDWFKITVNGALQLAEPDGDTGENRLEDLKVTDSDGDGVLSITGSGYAPVMANRVRLTPR